MKKSTIGKLHIIYNLRFIAQEQKEKAFHLNTKHRQIVHPTKFTFTHIMRSKYTKQRERE